MSAGRNRSCLPRRTTGMAPGFDGVIQPALPYFPQPAHVVGVEQSQMVRRGIGDGVVRGCGFRHDCSAAWPDAGRFA